MDLATQIQYLSMVIRQICEDNDLNKEVVIDDFIYMMNREDEKGE